MEKNKIIKGQNYYILFGGVVRLTTVKAVGSTNTKVVDGIKVGFFNNSKNKEEIITVRPDDLYDSYNECVRYYDTLIMRMLKRVHIKKLLKNRKS